MGISAMRTLTLLCIAVALTSAVPMDLGGAHDVQDVEDQDTEEASLGELEYAQNLLDSGASATWADNSVVVRATALSFCTKSKWGTPRQEFMKLMKALQTSPERYRAD